MGQTIAGIYIPEQGETNWAVDTDEFNDSLELLARRTQNLSDDGTTYSPDTISGGVVGGASLSSLLGANLAIDADDTLNATDTDTQRTDEDIEDVVGALLVASGAASVSYDDANDTLTIDATDTDTQAYSTVASGSVSLGGSETVDIDTGVAVDSNFYVPECNPPADCDYVVSLFRDDSGTGNWVIRFKQDSTAVTSGTVNWRLKRDGQ